LTCCRSTWQALLVQPPERGRAEPPQARVLDGVQEQAPELPLGQALRRQRTTA